MERLDKRLSQAGYGRKEARELIRSGRVRAGDRVATDPEEKLPPELPLFVDGALVAEGPVYLMLHKPQGYVSATRDARERTVLELLSEELRRRELFPVGRLDKDTTGLLLLTCDGALNHRLLAPARHVDKTYLAEVDGPLSEADVTAFAQGLRLSDFQAQGALLEILQASPAQSTARVTIHEGKFHQVKRMFEAVGRQVTGLHRVRFGPLALDATLSPGQWRELTEEEERLLYEAAQMEAHA